MAPGDLRNRGGVEAFRVALNDDVELCSRQTPSAALRLEAALRHRSRRGAASCYDLARDLAGSVKGLPLDLATNPKYTEGFGE